MTACAGMPRARPAASQRTPRRVGAFGSGEKHGTQQGESRGHYEGEGQQAVSELDRTVETELRVIDVRRLRALRPGRDSPIQSRSTGRAHR